MVILYELDQLMDLVDEKTIDNIFSSLDYVFKTKDDNILMSFRWMDRSQVVLFTTPENTSVWSENKEIRELAKDISGSGKEELFEYMLAIASYDTRNLEDLDDRIVEFEEELFNSKGLNKDNFRIIHRFRKEVWNKKRYLEKMELLTDELMMIDQFFNFIDKKYDKQFNHILRTQEYLDQIRQSYEAQIDIEQNSLMKFFTVVTSIFMPLTLIVGWFGMNLQMPEFNWEYGYPYVIALSVAIVGLMIWIFRKNKWL